MSIFVSTGAFKTKDINRVLEIANNNEFRNIELAPGLDYNADIRKILLDAKDDFHFLIHNYFPTPQIGFALNLASSDAKIEEQSMKMAYGAIDLCAELNAPYYSVHCGYCFDSDGKDLGNVSQVGLKRNSREKANSCFVRNLQSLIEYGKKKNIDVVIENNVVASFAKGDRGLLLGVDKDDILSILSDVGNDDLGFLMDLAHAKVSSNSYGFDVTDFINMTRDYVREVHVSENDGKCDQNLRITKESDVYQWLQNYKDRIITLEVYNLSVEEIREQIQVINEAIL